MPSFLLVLWKNEYFVFLTLRESLLAINHWLLLLKSLFTVANDTGMRNLKRTDEYHLQTLLDRQSLRRSAIH